MKFKAEAGKLVTFQNRLLRFDREGVYETNDVEEIRVLGFAIGVEAQAEAKPKTKPKEPEVDTF